jgi:hypothetical protein
MKRAMLFALLVVNLFLAALANAQVTQINCHDVDPGQHTWPGSQYTLYCGTASQNNGNEMWAALNELEQNAPNAFSHFQANPATFYLFHNAVEASEKLHVNPPTQTTFAFTVYHESPLKPLYTVVLEENEKNKPNTYLQNSVIHQAGEWTDFMYATTVESSGPRASQSTLFADELSADWRAFNAKSACGSVTQPGVFSGLQSSTGAYICDGEDGQGHGLNHGFSGNNENVLIEAWGTDFSQNSEIWSEQVAFQTGFTDGYLQGNHETIDAYYADSNFECTHILVEYLILLGQVPTHWPQGCPTH